MLAARYTRRTYNDSVKIRAGALLALLWLYCSAAPSAYCKVPYITLTDLTRQSDLIIFASVGASVMNPEQPYACLHVKEWFKGLCPTTIRFQLDSGELKVYDLPQGSAAVFFLKKPIRGRALYTDAYCGRDTMPVSYEHKIRVLRPEFYTLHVDHKFPHGDVLPPDDEFSARY